jgi:catechol 2,3-dioxygenase-like lactoylglutathione lyase family enzyme
MSSLVAPGFASPPDLPMPTVDLSIYRQVVEICFVVKDLDRTVDYWEKLGLKNIRRMGTQELPGILYRGGKSPLTLKMARGNIGAVRVTWIEPIWGSSDYGSFLKRHGHGVHHLTFAVKSPDELDKQVQCFKAKGVGVVMEGTWKREHGEARFADLDTADRGGGFTFELLYDPDLPARGTHPASENEEPFNKLTQYAFVVRDLRKVGLFYEDLGFGGTARDYINYSSNPERYYRGTPGKFEIYVGYWRWGTVNFEWIESAAGPSVFEEYLRNHGEGIQHVAVEVEDMDKSLATMNVKGVKVAQSGAFNYQNRRGRFAYIDTEPGTGVMIEFIWRETGNR